MIEELERGAAIGSALAGDLREAASLSNGHNSAPLVCPLADLAPSEVDQGQLSLGVELTGSQKKTANALRLNVERIAREAGIERVGFMTLTVGDKSTDGFRQVFDAKEANERINRLGRRFLPSIFKRWVIVSERHKSGAIHFHLVGEVAADVRTGFDWNAYDQNRAAGLTIKACSPHGSPLRALWAKMRRELPRQGFGRAELTPIRKTGECIAAYVAKYVEKNLQHRKKEDRGRKLVRYGGWNGTHCRSNDFAWASPGAAKWRGEVERLASIADIYCLPDVQKFFGPKWAWRLSGIMGAPGFEHEHWVERAMWAHVRDETAERLLRPLTEVEREEHEVELVWAGADGVELYGMEAA